VRTDLIRQSYTEVALCVEKYWASGRPFQVLLDIEKSRAVGGTTNSPERFEEEKDSCRESIYSTARAVFVPNHCSVKVIWGLYVRSSRIGDSRLLRYDPVWIGM
jgi:hypothetical protein